MPVVALLHHQPSRIAAAEPVVPRASPVASSGPAARSGEVLVITARSTRRQPRRLSAGRAAVRVLAVVMLVTGASVAVSPGGALPAVVTDVLGSCAEASAGMVNVAIAVDPGVLPGSPRGPETLCVTVAEGATGADVLVERARLLGRPAPRWAPSGLMCAIDGYPASGCGERVDGSFRYWSYHLGDAGSWSFARTGPALRRASAERMEGWHFIAGANSPADPPPRVSASSSAVCPPAPPATTAPPAAPPAVPQQQAPTAIDAGVPNAPTGTGGTGNPGSTTRPDGSGGGNGNGGAGVLGAGRNGDGSTTTGGSGDGQVGDASAGDGAAGSAGDDAAGGDGDGDAMAAGRGPAMAAARSSEPSATSGAPVAVVLMVVAVAALGIGGLVRSRRRSQT